MIKNNDNVSKRLDRLAGLDSVAAEQIRQALNSNSSAIHADVIASDAGHKVSEWLKGFDSPPDVVVLPGIGDGNRVAALLEALPTESKLLLLERNIQSAAELFLRYPLESHMEEPRLHLALGDDIEQIEIKLFKTMDLPKCPTIGIFDFTELPPDDAKFYETALLKARNGLRTDIMNINTLTHLGPLWQYNTLRNLPTLFLNPGITRLKNAFPNMPAIMVAAGPSLNKTIEVLRNIADKFVIISTGTALKALRQAGIKPDLVMSVDASKFTGVQFADTPCDDIYLACSSLAFPDIPPKFKGIFSGHISANPAGKWISSLGDEKGIISSGGTVSASIIDLATQMGCNPIISVGLDLCLGEDGITHADNTMYHGRRFKADDLLSVPGNYRKQVSTTKQMYVYIDLITRYVKHRTDFRFINVNDDGAQIEGMELTPSSELAAFAGERLNAFDIIRERHETWKHQDPEPALAAMEKITGQLKEISADSVNAAMIVNELIMITQSPRHGDEEKARSKLKALEEFDEKTMLKRESSLVIDMSLRPIYYTMGNKLQLNGKYSNAVAANRQSRELYKQIAGAAMWTEKLLTNAISEIKQKTTNDSTASNLHTTQAEL